ncbi:DUF1080 domain-containing protein [Zunongwangia sp. F260]|uniref:DUF1080 domain-containing protein n=1 Tax=Autumnicola lenta TaxID=3075593 RepID=A0ABU3CP24_9FLAO|nr:DUF1080 domain-containing protein [Zunongwangia sp. F260]MDT0648099.1 DUF1080 domain-containing protein [Zunongwangia sp. F260]
MNIFFYRIGTLLLISVFLMVAPFSFAQSQQILLNNLSDFKSPASNWHVAGNVYANLYKPNELRITEGTGILVNKFIGSNNKDLWTEKEYGSIDLELDYLMAKGSNSGIYFMGQYELQLRDSWGNQNLTSAENGGIYERWDENRPEGQKGYEGYLPRQNVSKAPGLWQNLKVSFQAPRFDELGNKIENAKFLRVELNGVTIHEDVELFGPTRGAMSIDEKPLGPLRIQGDHGAVAFRDIEVTSYEKPRPELANLQVAVYEGTFNEMPAHLDSLPPEFQGKAVILTSNLNTKSDQFLIRYTGDLKVQEAGKYSFNLETPGGAGFIRINQKEVVPFNGQNGRGSVELPAGVVPFELLYSKYEDWVEPNLGMTIAGPGIREYLVTEGDNNFETPVNPILVEARENTILRSFMDLPVNENSGGYRVTHSVNVGSPQQLHYTYDLDKGSIVQIWRGDFLDATPMWYSRGDGSSRPRGAVEHFGIPNLTLARLNSPQQEWINDTVGTQYRPLGYHLDNQDRPTFMYRIYELEVADALQVLEMGHGFRRTIEVQNPAKNLYARLARGSKIEFVSKDLYLINDKAYYLRLENSVEAKPVVRTVEGQQELLVPVREEVTYSILY